MRKYHHLGVPTDTPRPGEYYLEKLDIHVLDYRSNECGVEWMRFGPRSAVPDVVKTVPHLAFEVDDLDAAIAGQEILIAPNSPSPGVRVAFVLVGGAPVEYLQYDREKGPDAPSGGPRVLLLLAGGFEEYEASVFTDVLGWSRTDGDIPVRVTTAALRPRIRGTWNLDVVPEMLAEEVRVDDFDALAVPGGFEEAGFYEDAYDPGFLRLIREFHRQNKWISAICVGALPLARAGILEGRRATTYHLNGSPRRNQLAALGAVVEDRMIVTDGRVTTSSCPATALQVAFDLLAALTTPENAAKVRERMGFTESQIRVEPRPNP